MAFQGAVEKKIGEDLAEKFVEDSWKNIKGGNYEDILSRRINFVKSSGDFHRLNSIGITNVSMNASFIVLRVNEYFCINQRIIRSNYKQSAIIKLPLIGRKNLLNLHE